MVFQPARKEQKAQAPRGARRWSWTIFEVNFILSNLEIKKQALITQSLFVCANRYYSFVTLAACGPRAPCSTSKETS